MECESQLKSHPPQHMESSQGGYGITIREDTEWSASYQEFALTALHIMVLNRGRATPPRQILTFVRSTEEEKSISAHVQPIIVADYCASCYNISSLHKQGFDLLFWHTPTNQRLLPWCMLHGV